jgi:plastocyanin
MNRREFFHNAGIGSATAATLSALASSSEVAARVRNNEQPHQHEPIDGPLSNATISFGQWRLPLDRFPNTSPPGPAGQHQVIPAEVKIKAGGAVNFVISGLHQVIVYDDGTRPSDINPNLTTPTTGTPAGVPLINDPDDRLYRGLDPSLHPRDRVEVVTFAEPGIYLVICGVQVHFVDDGMFGFVRVLP